jgi:hypothetical protein
VLSTDVDRLVAAVRELIADPSSEAALARYGLQRFLADWDLLLTEVAR